MAKAINTLHTLTVSGPKCEKLILQFVDRDVRDAAADAIERAGGVILKADQFGTAIERTIEGALETAQFWLGILPKA